MDEKKLIAHWEKILNLIGEDRSRPGLKETPKRIAKMYEELFIGYDDNKKPKVTTFPNGEDGITYNEMIIDTGDYHSLCEHHMMPFFGTYWFGYIPNPKGKIIGLSKVARVINYFSSRLQVQERLTQEVVDYIWNVLAKECKDCAPLGMGLVMSGEHLCKRMRGVKKTGQMTTIALRGNFENSGTRQEFLEFVNK